MKADMKTPEMTDRARVAGLTVPLFSLKSLRGWGIGEIGDLSDFARWAKSLGFGLVQLLPLGEISGGESSPYAALSAFGIDPIYVSMADLDDLPESSWPAALGPEGMNTLARVRASARVDYDAVRGIKTRALCAAYEAFTRVPEGDPRRRGFDDFVREESDWLEGYASFRALKDAHRGAPWWQWSKDTPRTDTGRYLYAQWIAHSQWRKAREELRGMGVEVMGDLPFMVGRDSADVWAHPQEFRADASVGVPGDQFDPEGQHWGLPPYAWDVMRTNGFAWLKRRAKYSATLYDRFRIDHLVGFFRTYMRRESELRDARGKLRPGFFDPAEEPAQAAHGEAVVRAMIEGAKAHGARIVAEDLGVIPNYLRPVLTALGVPGYKVLIWEKDGAVFRDPKSYPKLSLACFATHDTDPVAVWWTSLAAPEREAVSLLFATPQEPSESFTPAVHEALLDVILGSQSELVLLMLQDALGTRDRINVPSTVGPHNWTWRLPFTLDLMSNDGAVRDAMARVARAVSRSGRVSR